MSEDRQFRIVISADASGAAAGAQSASRSIDNLTGSINTSAASTEKHAGHTRELRRLFGQLDEMVPGLGRAFESAFAAGPAAGMVLAILAAIEAFKMFQELVDKQANKDSFAMVFDSAEKARESVRKLNEQSEEFWRNLEGHRSQAASESVEKMSQDLIKAEVDALKAHGVPADQAEAWGQRARMQYRDRRMRELDEEIAATKNDLGIVEGLRGSDLSKENETWIAKKQAGIAALPERIKNGLDPQRAEYIRQDLQRDIDRMRDPLIEMDKRLAADRGELTRATAERDTLSQGQTTDRVSAFAGRAMDVGANIRTLQQGGSLTDAQKQQNAEMSRLLLSMGYNAQVAIEIMRQCAGTAEQQRQIMDAVLRRLLVLESRSKSTPIANQ